MNVFYLDECPIKSARALCDKHVVKMLLETFQILSTTLIEKGFQLPFLYKPTHKNHPCVKWTGLSRDNFDWVFTHGVVLCNEYTYRYSKRHKTQQGYEELIHHFTLNQIAPPLFSSLGLTEIFLCMPTQHQIKNNPIQSYRNYYSIEKRRFAKWTKRNPPEWF